MKNRFFVSAFVGLVVMLATSAVLAQGRPVIIVVDNHVTPGKEAQFEEARKEAISFFTEHDFPYNQLAFRSDTNTYRFLATLDNWEDMNTTEQWFQQAGFPPSGGKLNDANNQVSMSIWRPRPNLTYIPDNPRIPQGEAGFVREVRFSLRPGTAPEAADVLEEMVAVNKRHNIRSVRIVWFQFSGSEGPVVSVFLLARDVVDSHTQGAKDTEMMGDEIRTLRQRLSGLATSREFVEWTIRQDLRYLRSTN